MIAARIIKVPSFDIEIMWDRFRVTLYNIKHLITLLTGPYRIYFKQSMQLVTGSSIDKEAVLMAPYSIADTIIGRYSYVNINARISRTTIGSFCSIGPNLVCGWGIHPLNGFSTSPIFYSTRQQLQRSWSTNNKIIERLPISIGHDVFIGANVTILDGVTIGNGAVIGAGAVVSKNIPPYAIAVGSPIKIIKFRFPTEVVDKLSASRWWDLEADMLETLEKDFFDIDKILSAVELHRTRSKSRHDV